MSEPGDVTVHVNVRGSALGTRSGELGSARRVRSDRCSVGDYMPGTPAPTGDVIVVGDVTVAAEAYCDEPARASSMPVGAAVPAPVPPLIAAPTWAELSGAPVTDTLPCASTEIGVTVPAASII